MARGEPAKTVTVTLTIQQAQMLSRVAGNGWGDGDAFGLNDPAVDGRACRGACGGARDANVFWRAYQKLNAAIRDAGGF